MLSSAGSSFDILLTDSLVLATVVPGFHLEASQKCTVKRSGILITVMPDTVEQVLKWMISMFEKIFMTVFIAIVASGGHGFFPALNLLTVFHIYLLLYFPLSPPVLQVDCRVLCGLSWSYTPASSLFLEVFKNS